MAYKKLRQEVEPFKLPDLDKDQTQQQRFEKYCEENGLTTEMEKLASAANPIYFPYLLDYVGYDDEDPAKPREHARSTYVKAAGRVLMARKITQALGKHLEVPTRLVMPEPKWMPSQTPNTAIATVEFRIEAKMGSEWEIRYQGAATARRIPSNDYDKFFIEKAETAARARAIAAAGIGIDISGGMTTIEEMQELQKLESVALEGEEKRAVDIIEMRIKACNTLKELNTLAQELAKDVNVKKLNSVQTSNMRDIFEQKRAELSEKESSKKSE